MSTQELVVAAEERPGIVAHGEGKQSSEQSSCCSRAEQASCCEPAAKAGCCGASADGGCGCR
jgi:hypothetical protein